MLLDTAAMYFRAFYGVPDTLRAPDGTPVNAVRGLLDMIARLVAEFRPADLVACWDEDWRPQWRVDLIPSYKTHRVAEEVEVGPDVEVIPDPLTVQVPIIVDTLTALGIPIVGKAGYEADDIIGTLATRARAAGRKVVLVTRDKDLSQLVRPGDEYWDYIGDIRFGYDDIAGRFGVRPERMPCFLALMGDAVDNIPGVPGVGRKTASTLFHHFESLTHLYSDLDRVLKIKLRNAGFVCGQLRDYRESAFLARQLTEIACDMPLDVEFGQLRRQPPDLGALDEFYDCVGFGRLLRNQAERIAAFS